MRNLLIGSLLLLAMAVVSAGDYRFRPADNEAMRSPQYETFAPQYPAPAVSTYPRMPGYGQSQWNPAQALPAFPQQQGFLSNWELAEPQLFEPPMDLPYADLYQNVDTRSPAPFYSSGDGQRWRGITWPKDAQTSGDRSRLVETDGFMPQNSVFTPRPSQQAEVSPGRNTVWR